PRFDSKPSYEGRGDGDRPARRFEDRAGAATRNAGHGERSYAATSRPSGYADRPATAKPRAPRADRRGFGDSPRTASRPASSRSSADEGRFERSARPSFGGKPAGRSKGSRRQGQVA